MEPKIYRVRAVAQTFSKHVFSPDYDSIERLLLQK